MRSVVTCLFICMLGACSGMPRRQEIAVSPCLNNEASYDCQVERYNSVNMD
jgi:hypothetical protein